MQAFAAWDIAMLANANQKNLMNQLQRPA